MLRLCFILLFPVDTHVVPFAVPSRRGEPSRFCAWSSLLHPALISAEMRSPSHPPTFDVQCIVEANGILISSMWQYDDSWVCGQRFISSEHDSKWWNTDSSIPQTKCKTGKRLNYAFGMVSNCVFFYLYASNNQITEWMNKINNCNQRVQI